MNETKVNQKSLGAKFAVNLGFTKPKVSKFFYFKAFANNFLVHVKIFHRSSKEKLDNS